MTWTFLTPILLLSVSNVFMTFAWVSASYETVRWTVSRGERPELGRGAGRPTVPVFAPSQPIKN